MAAAWQCCRLRARRVSMTLCTKRLGNTTHDASNARAYLKPRALRLRSVLPARCLWPGLLPARLRCRPTRPPQPPAGEAQAGRTRSAVWPMIVQWRGALVVRCAARRRQRQRMRGSGAARAWPGGRPHPRPCRTRSPCSARRRRATTDCSKCPHAVRQPAARRCPQSSDAALPHTWCGGAGPFRPQVC